MSFRTVTLGADPEFGLLDKNGKLVTPGSDRAPLHDEMGTQFGRDGCGAIMELRPPPAADPETLVNTIRNIIQGGCDRNPVLAKLRFKGGSMAGNQPLGGHIHFGSSSFREDGKACADVCEAFNRIIAPVYAMLEDQVEAIDRRLGTSYGSLKSGHYRTQPHGVEYRVLPSWLTSPVDALGALALGHLIAINSGNARAMTSILGTPEFDIEMLEDCNKLYLSFYLKEIAKCLTELPRYRDYRKWIVPIFQKMVNKETLFMGDMKESWGIKIKKEETVNV